MESLEQTRRGDYIERGLHGEGGRTYTEMEYIRRRNKHGDETTQRGYSIERGLYGEVKGNIRGEVTYRRGNYTEKGEVVYSKREQRRSGESGYTRRWKGDRTERAHKKNARKQSTINKLLYIIFR